jgi:hypothetical protein
MKYILTILLITMTFFLSFKEKNKVKPQKQIFLLLGQSNMAGRGIITAEYQSLQHDRVLMLNKNNEWVIAKHPLHFDKPKVAGVGPGLSFGISIAKAFPNDTIYLVPCAVGGTSISKWVPGAYDKSTNTYPYDDALLRIREAMKKGKITGVIWLQGEADSNPKASTAYLSKLEQLIENIRRETHNPKLPFVAGELGTYRSNYKLINEQLHLLPNKVAFTGYVTSENLNHKGDTTHFDSASATEYGYRFANGMLKMIKK